MHRTACAILALIMLSAAPVRAQHGFWQPDERVLITSFMNARGIATDQRHVFVATDHGLEVYDAAFHRWLAPSTIEDGYPALYRPRAIAYDPRERGIWLLTEAQLLFAWSSFIGRWEQRSEAELPSDVRRQLLRDDEFDRIMSTLPMSIGHDAFGRRFPITALVAADRRDTYWVANAGGNFLFVDTRNLSSEPRTFGTINRGVRSITLAPDGSLYFGEDERGGRNGITRADTTLQRWQQYESRVAEGPQRAVLSMLATPDAVYAAAPDGVFQLEGTGWNRILDADARALAWAGGRAWIGTRGLLGWLDASGAFQRSDLPLQTIHDLAARNDTLWIASELGLASLAAGAVTTHHARAAFSVAASSSAVVALLGNGIYMWNGAAWDGPLRNTSVQMVGRPVSVSADGDFVWIGGTAGLAEWNGRTQTWRYLRVPEDIPEGPVYDVVHENGRLWLATPAGALRVSWR